MAKEQRSPEALALVYLRNARGWTQKQLTAALGLTDDKRLGRYENGDPPLSRETLETIVAPLRFPSEAVDVLLFAHRLIFPLAESSNEDVGSPVPVTPEERERIARTAMAAGWSVAEAVRGELTRQKRARKWDAASREAEELFQRLFQLPADERLAVVKAFPDLNTGALAVRLCEASLKAAADKAVDALELAALALAVAERLPAGAVGECWSSRLQGYCWAHLANARRVANDFDGAHEAFTRALKLWRAGRSADSGWLPEWRFLSLEASLRREQRRFSEALELLDRALALCAGDPAARARCLLTKENVYEAMGDVASALAVLTEAAPFVEASRELRLRFALRFKSANNLYQLQRFMEAAKLLPEIGELALHQGAELDGLRVAWLGARIAAGLGRKREAVAGLQRVVQRFKVLKHPYETALSSLDLAVLWLEEGRTTEVRGLAVAMAWIFKAKGIQREALAALHLFRKAAERDVATAELACRVIAEIEALKRSASPRIVQGEAAMAV